MGLRPIAAALRTPGNRSVDILALHKPMGICLARVAALNSAPLQQKQNSFHFQAGVTLVGTHGVSIKNNSFLIPVIAAKWGGSSWKRPSAPIKPPPPSNVMHMGASYGDRREPIFKQV